MCSAANKRRHLQPTGQQCTKCTQGLCFILPACEHTTLANQTASRWLWSGKVQPSQHLHDNTQSTPASTHTYTPNGGKINHSLFAHTNTPLEAVTDNRPKQKMPSRVSPAHKSNRPTSWMGEPEHTAHNVRTVRHLSQICKMRVECRMRASVAMNHNCHCCCPVTQRTQARGEPTQRAGQVNPNS